MKKFSALIAFLFAVMISSTALAADWVEVYSDSEDGYSSQFYVDKDTIKRGIHSEQYKISQADGFSAIMRLEFGSGDSAIKEIWLIGFFTENGVNKVYILDKFDENGKLRVEENPKLEATNADGSDGKAWPTIWDYIENNLP